MKLSLGNKIDAILKVDNDAQSVTLQYADGIRGIVDLGYLFSKPKGLAAEIMRGGSFFRCFVENGALAWPNGLELCPDSLKAKLKPLSTRRRR